MQKSETRAVQARASRKWPVKLFRENISHFTIISQLISNAARVRPEAVALLSLAAGGGGHG